MQRSVVLNVVGLSRALLGGPHTPAVGWAAGIERLAMLIDQPAIDKPQVVLIPMGEAAEAKATGIIADLRRDGTLAALEGAVAASVNKKGAGSFTLPGLLKISTVNVPAKPKRKGINPFTKEEQVFAAKPATVRIKARALKKLKDAAL